MVSKEEEEEEEEEDEDNHSEEEEEDDAADDGDEVMKTRPEPDDDDEEEESKPPAAAATAGTASIPPRRSNTNSRTTTTKAKKQPPDRRRAPKRKAVAAPKKSTPKKSPKPNDNNSNDDENETHVCSHCQKSFSSIRALNYHTKKLVCQPKPCPGCQRSFPTLLALRHHQNSSYCTGSVATATTAARNDNESESDNIGQQQQQDADDTSTGNNNSDNDGPVAASSPRGTNNSTDPATQRRSSPRRSRARINYALLDKSDDDDDDNEEEEEEEEVEVDEEEEVIAKDDMEQDDPNDSDNVGNDDNKDSDFSENSNNKKRPTKRVKSSAASRENKKKPAAAAADDFACHYCNRQFKGAAGLKYHVDFFVCRPNQRPGGPVRKGKRKRAVATAGAADATATADDAASSSSPGKFKRIRGALNDRICEFCSRVFTSVLGLQYHIEKKVCQQVKQAAALAFPPLQPGMKFDTPYGVVQVVRDDAAVPTVRLRSDLRNAARHFTNAKIKHEIKITRNVQSVAVTQLARRKRLRHLYERSIMASPSQAHLMNQSNVFACYFGKDPRLIPRKEHVAQPTAGPLQAEDPCAPEGSFPDRIVECILVEDKRVRYSSLEEHAMRASKKRSPSQENDNEQTDGTSSPSSTTKPTRLFLRRRMLTEPYSETTDLLTCQDCGTVFTSRSGCTYHVTSKVCFQKIDTGKEETRERIELMDKRAIAYLLQREKRVAKGLEERFMPIDFILSLNDQGMLAEMVAGSEAAGASIDNTTTGPIASIMKSPPANPIQKLDKTIVGDPNFKDPRLILAELKAELRHQQSILCGPMYPSVFKALGYKKPRKAPLNKKRPRPKPKPPAAPLPPPRPTRSEPIASLPPIPPPQLKSPVHPQPDNHAVEKLNKMHPSPPSATNGRFSDIVKAAMPPRRKRDRKALPIFDMRPLAGEIRAGRYPTMKTRDGDDPPHSPTCALCKKIVRDEKNPQKDPLLPCDFCEKQVHLSCMLSKIIIKEPEPGEDFMCYYCINCLCTRRARAERRRLEKLTNEHASTSTSVPVLDVTSTIVVTQHRLATDPAIVPVKDLVSFTEQAVQGREYDCVVAQGRRLHDLVELTRDSQKRLAQHAETARMNAARQPMLDL